MLTWRRLGDERYRIAMCYFWPKYDVELTKPMPKGWMIIGHLKKREDGDEDMGICDHVDIESPDGKISVWHPCRVIRIYANS